ncbi:hypothetical protein MSZK_17960 [Mycobacterium sp. shizuoka-1]|nr:hypothetical protein MSZK_17960 [Mycobacterium sp. shizuoka-1]
MGEPDDTEKVRLDLGAKVVEIDILGGGHVGVTGIVDQNVEAPPTTDRGVRGGADMIIVGDVEFDDGQTVWFSRGEIVERRGCANACDDAVPGSQSRLGDGTSETAGGSGDEEDM